MLIADAGSFCFRAAVLAILCTLAVAAGAYADEPIGPPSATELTEAQALGEGQPAAQGGQSEEQKGTAEGQPRETGQETPVSSEETSGASGGIAGEETSEPPPGAGTVESAPASTGTGETTETTAVEAPKVAEQTTQEPGKEAGIVKTGQENPETTASLHSDSGTSQTPSVRAAGAGETAGESQALVAGPVSPPPTAPTAGDGEAQAPTTPAIGGGGPSTGMPAAQRAGALSCTLSALGNRATDNCTVGWLGEKRVLGSSTVSFAPIDGSLVAAMTDNVPPGGGHGGSAVGNAPISPPPGPAPSGASGAAVGGASGVAPSAFLSLAGLLLLAAPRAMRRLRLSSQPWLTACFVLIPERPG